MYVSKNSFALIVVIILMVSTLTLTFAHGGDPDLIHACVKTQTGAIRIVEPNEGCPKKWTSLDWNRNLTPDSPGGGGVFSVSSVANQAYLCAGPNLGASGTCNDPTESREVPLPNTGKLVSLAVYPYRNTIPSGLAEIKVLLNGIPTDLQVQVPAGSTSIQTITMEVPVQAGDLVTVWSHTETQDGDVRFNATFEYRTD